MCDIMQRRTNTKKDDAVSPVVGVMLMLVVTIIIAAVVSMYAGGLIGSAEKAPTLTMDVTIKNTGYYATSVFEAKVMSVSEPIATKDLKLVTSWKASNKTVTGTHSKTGADLIDGNISIGGTTVTSAGNVFGWGSGGGFEGMTAPWGYGNGVQSGNSGKPNDKEQQFGNYTLLGGTVMTAWPAGQSGGYVTTTGGSGYGTTNQYYYDEGAWAYSEGTTVDGMQAVLGENWQYLRTGDTVNVKLIHLPSGQTIYDKNVVVS
ncbi:hypothetical protein McpCs1_05070 [Methanocorpusculaceae archaeon Cs1]|uniref:Archaeal Type IV pilin N-terminal domain-containing protein n=2 Tax=Methanorbis rubei TaxID=3028300 RepID=A0AAE4MEZ9_9EURY|nr:hypothetical protein [Methanocorpusculaceae archaeon Cs1]